jgi:hypothetical protein
MIKVATNSALTHRDGPTLVAGVAGIPISNYALLMAIFSRISRGGSGQSAVYDSVCKKYGSKRTSNVLAPLFIDIKKNGIKQPVTGYQLNSRVELLGGHHRAAIASVLNISELPINLLSLDVLKNFKCDLAPIKKSYEALQDSTTLGRNRSYNPLEGLLASREGYDRLKYVYQEVINVKGKSLLDVGCSDGFFGAFMTTRCFDVTFLDSFAPCLAVCRSKIAAIQSKYPAVANFVNAELAPWLETIQEKYSVVLALDVLQHVAFAAVKSGQAVGVLAACLDKLIGITEEKLVVSMGSWDALHKHGISDTVLYDAAQKNNWRLKFIGCPDDVGAYGGRELYVLYP